MTRLAEIAARAEAVMETGNRQNVRADNFTGSTAQALFLAHSYKDVTFLLALVASKEAAIQRVRDLLSGKTPEDRDWDDDAYSAHEIDHALGDEATP